MVIVKNSWGVSVAMSGESIGMDKMNSFTGSSLTRKKYPKKERGLIEELIKRPSELIATQPKTKPLRSMSKRTKTKIRKKLFAFAGVQSRLSFVTLTFVNKVSDERAIKALHKFLDNVKKQFPEFHYLWVAERQMKNLAFPGNIHFHIITNRYWKIDKWLTYWVELQEGLGILRRNQNALPSSAFDVRKIKSENIKVISNYFTKYVTKNNGKFSCQVWHCSKNISALQTDFYSDMKPIKEAERLQALGFLDGQMIMFPGQYCNVHLIPLNNRTINFYNPINKENMRIWNNIKKKEVDHV